MKLSELRGLKKDDKYKLLQQYDNIDDLGEDVIRKLSNDAINVKTLISTKTNNYNILLEMLYNEKNWKSPQIINNILERTIIPTSDRLKFIESRIWEKIDFPYDRVKYAITKDLFIDKKGNGFVPLIIKMAKQKPMPSELMRAAHYDATTAEMLEIIKLTETNIYSIFDSTAMQNKLPIKIFKDVALEKLSKNLNLQQLSLFFYNKVLDDEIYDRLFKGTNKLMTTTYEKIKSVYSNKLLTSKTFENIFYSYIESETVIGSWRDYFLLLSDCPLNKKMNGEILDFIEYINDTQTGLGDIAENMAWSYMENPTADKEIINTLRNTFNSNQPKIIGALNKNSMYSDKEIEIFITDTIKKTDKNANEAILNLFIEIMNNSNTPPRKGLVDDVWSILLSSKGFNYIDRGESSIIYTALNTFFAISNGSRYGQKATLPKEIRIEKGLEYFNKFNIADWVLYSDEIPLNDLKNIWKSNYIKDADMSIDRYSSRPGSRATKLKYHILEGKYSNVFGQLYFDETGNSDFLNADLKEIFLLK